MTILKAHFPLLLQLEKINLTIFRFFVDHAAENLPKRFQTLHLPTYTKETAFPCKI